MRLRLGTVYATSLLVITGLLVLPAATATTTTSTTANSACGTAAAVPIRHVVWIWMENRSNSDVMGSSKAPYLTGLAAQCLVATSAHAITHPSAPNYVGATGGVPLSKLPATDCTNCRQPGGSIFTQALSWRVYQESMTTNCRLTKDAGGLYVVRHNPVTYFTAAKAGCRIDDVPYTRLGPDLAAAPLRQFTFITPNLAHDMHDGSVSAGDTWLHEQLPAILSRPEYLDGSTLVFVMWDEGSGGSALKGTDCTSSSDWSCHVPLVVVGAGLKHASDPTPVSHYDVLATTETLLGVPVLGPGTPMTLPFAP